jgi:hypothetical protein
LITAGDGFDDASEPSGGHGDAISRWMSRRGVRRRATRRGWTLSRTRGKFL